jgi:hypothetical protein
MADRPISDQVLDLIEGIPVSYLTVHQSLVAADDKLPLRSFLDRAVSGGRLRLIKSYEGEIVDGVVQHNDLYAVIKTEPNVQSEK